MKHSHKPVNTGIPIRAWFSKDNTPKSPASEVVVSYGTLAQCSCGELYIAHIPKFPDAYTELERAVFIGRAYEREPCG